MLETHKKQCYKLTENARGERVSRQGGTGNNTMLRVLAISQEVGDITL